MGKNWDWISSINVLVASGLSKHQIAELLNVGDTTIDRWIQGSDEMEGDGDTDIIDRCSPSKDNIRRLKAVSDLIRNPFEVIESVEKKDILEDTAKTISNYTTLCKLDNNLTYSKKYNIDDTVSRSIRQLFYMSIKNYLVESCNWSWLR
jgi:transposase